MVIVPCAAVCGTVALAVGELEKTSHIVTTHKSHKTDTGTCAILQYTLL